MPFAIPDNIPVIKTTISVLSNCKYFKRYVASGAVIDTNNGYRIDPIIFLLVSSFPNKIKDNIINTTLEILINKDGDKENNSFKIIAIPLVPPVTKLFGNKNKL